MAWPSQDLGKEWGLGEASGRKQGMEKPHRAVESGEQGREQWGLPAPRKPAQGEEKNVKKRDNIKSFKAIDMLCVSPGIGGISLEDGTVPEVPTSIQ